MAGLLLAGTILLISGHVQADGVEDSSFPTAMVRMVHAVQDRPSMVFDAGGIPFGELAYGGVSSYRMVPAGRFMIRAGKVQKKIRLKADQHYTIALVQKSGRRLDLEPLDDPQLKILSRSGVALYNFSSFRWLALHVPYSKLDLLSALPPLSVAMMPILRPVTIRLEIRDVDRPLARFDKVRLARGQITSLFMFGSGRKTHSALAYRSLTME
ncbi:MAG: DUF4397 domain-containing protein [Magnetococcales bacterium]|nr:DUF4397 domain-containing protein [Magnetococcales bacterium]